MAAQPAIITLVETLGNQNLPSEESIRQYDPTEHDVFNHVKRKKRKIVEAVPGQFLKDKDGSVVRNSDGDPVPVTKVRYEDVNRIAVAMQQLIVQRRVAFINSGNMNVVCRTSNKTEETMLAMVKKIIDDNKIYFRLNEIAERKMSELQVALLFYSDIVEKGYWGDLAPTSTVGMRTRVLSPLLGDKLLPVFDGSGKMVYFARGYKSSPDMTSQFDFNNPESTDLPTQTAEDVEHLDIYSDEYILKFERERGIWVFKDRIKHSYTSIPVIYWSQPKPEWANVQWNIERIETIISNFGDTNDANGSPILLAKGIIKSMPASGESAKVLNIVPKLNREGKEVGDADVKYVTWDRAPESVKLELETHINLIYSLTDTPDISTKGMAELGLQSGVAFDRVFMGAHLGAMKHTQGNFGEGVQRMFNFLKKACAAINTSLKPALSLPISAEFPLFRINDEAETVNMLVSATGGEPILSRKTAVELSGLVKDPKEENKRIDQERDTLGREIEDQDNED